MSLFGQPSSDSLLGSNNTQNQNQNQNQQKPLFGSVPTHNSQSSGGGLFGSNASISQPQQSGGGLFGSSQQQNNEKSNSGGGLFGSNQQNSSGAGGLFPPRSTAAAGGGSFGSASSTQQQPSSGLFGPASNTSQPSQPSGGSSLFGGGTNQQNTGSGLFGTNNHQGTSQQSGGGLFGGIAQQSSTGSGAFGSTSQANTGGSIFGNSQSQTGGSSGSGGLFGFSTANQQASQPQQGNSLFSNMQNNQTQNQQGSNLFGGQQTTQNSKPTLSLFGNNNQAPQQQPQQQKPSLFQSLGASTTNTQPQQATSLFSNTTTRAAQPQPQSPLLGATSRLPSLTLGQSLSQAPSNAPTTTIPGVKIDVSNIRGTTRFSDLHEKLQKQIEQIDVFISDQIALQTQCEGMLPHHSASLATVPQDVEYIRTRMDAVETALDNDGVAIKEAKGLVQRDADDARRCFRTVEMLKLPQQFHYASMWHGAGAPRRGGGEVFVNGDGEGDPSMDLVGYFNEEAQQMDRRLEGYMGNIAEIEAHLQLVEANMVVQGQQLMFRKAGRTPEDRVRELGAVLREFEGGILGVARKVGAVREGVQEVVSEGR